MKNKTIKGVIVVFQVVFLIALCASCGDRESSKQQAQEKPQRVEPAQAKPQADKAAGVDEKDVFSMNIEKGLQEISQDMKVLKKQVETYAADTMDEFEQDMQTLADKEQQAYTQLKQLPETTGAMLADAKTELTAMAEDIQLSYRTLYEKYIEQVMRDYSSKIEALKERSEEMADDARQAFEMKMLEIADKEQQAYTQLKQLPELTGQAWQDMKKELDTSIEELAELYDQALAEETAEQTS